MKLSYAICVCNEAKELYSLLAFLKKVKDPEDEINLLVDSNHVSVPVRKVLEIFKDDIVQNNRGFDGNFSTHRNFHFEKCTGDYVFIIDPDEMPQEVLIKNIKKILEETDADLIWLPRINIHPGSTEEWLEKCKFKVNDMGWINWPDYTGRICKNDGSIRYGNNLHETLQGYKKSIRLQPHPSIALWHIKSVEKQECRWNLDTFEYTVPDGSKAYDDFM